MNFIKKDTNNVVKVFDISNVKEKVIRYIEQNNYILRVIRLPNVVSSQIFVNLASNYVVFVRNSYECDLKLLVYKLSIFKSEISELMLNLSKNLMILSEFEM